MRVYNFYVSNIVYIEVNDVFPFFILVVEKYFIDNIILALIILYIGYIIQ